MDEPCGLPPKVYLPSEDPPRCIVGEVECALCFDDKDEFLRLIKDPSFYGVDTFFGIHEIFVYDAVNCAAAFVNGETKGIFDIQDLMEGCTPLHYAAMNSSLKITKYLLDSGHSVDVYSDWPSANLKQANPIDFIIDDLLGFLHPRWIHRHSVYELLVFICCIRRRDLEILRMLVRSTQNKERVKQTFMDYADKREMAPVALLYLAAPELFLSSIATLNHALNSLENRTDIEEAMLLLVDALALAGHKFVAYTRLQYSNEQADFLYLDIAFLVREVARIKQRLSSTDDYFLRFFKPVRPEADQLTNIPGDKRVKSWPRRDGELLFMPALPFELKRRDLDQAYINKVFPSLTTKDADRLNNAIEKKLSLMPTLYGRLEDFIETRKRGAKAPLQKVPFSLSTNFNGSMRSFTYMAKEECGFDFKNTPTNSVRNISVKLANLGFLFSHHRLFQYSNAIKRVIK